MIPDIDDDSFYELVGHFRYADFDRERLRHSGDSRAMFAILQAECRHKCHTKLRNTLENQRFLFPNRLAAEQASDERVAIFNATLAGGADSVADITCGLGIDAMALARSCGHVKAFDLQSEVTEALTHNAVSAGLGNLEAINADSIEWLDSSPESFDVIFVDPARRDKGGRRTYSLADCGPDVEKNLPLLMSHCRRLIVKASPMLDVTDTVRRLPGTSAIYAVGTTRECKEILVVVDRDYAGSPRMCAVTVDGFGAKAFEATDCTGVKMPGYFDGGQDVRYIMEPWPSVMKLGCFDAVSCVTGMSQISRDTHLFVSAERPEADLPGRLYEICGIVDFNKHSAKNLKSLGYDELNVTCRNFPLTPTDLVRRLKIREGGNKRLFAVTTASGAKLLIVASQAEF